MGLAGRKVKQRIGPDPRNLSWADDASKFGSAYLSKFGWDSSKGLGVTGDGRTTHVKVEQKLDMLGIGAAHMRDPNGIAWKQNRDFENLLKRLNEQMKDEGGEGAAENGEEGTKVEGFVSEGNINAETEDVEAVNEKKKKKKDDEREEGKKRKRKDKDDMEHKTKKRKRSKEPEEQPEVVDEKLNVLSAEASETPVPTTQPIIPRHRAHRARAIAAKKMLSSSATAISEILGIAPTPSSSVTASGSATPQGQLTKLDDDIVGEKITTSTKSVADYFKEKLLSKSSGQSRSLTPDTPDDGIARGGIGSSRFRMESWETGASASMNKFASLTTSKFLAVASAAFTPSISEDAPDGQEEQAKVVVNDEDNSRKRKNKQKKDKHAKDCGSEQLKGESKKKKRRKKAE